MKNARGHRFPLRRTVARPGSPAIAQETQSRAVPNDDRYHAALVAHGVTGYDRRALDDDYRLSLLWQIATPVWQAAYEIPWWIFGGGGECVIGKT